MKMTQNQFCVPKKKTSVSELFAKFNNLAQALNCTLELANRTLE